MTVHRTPSRRRRRRGASARKTPKIVVIAGIFLFAVLINVLFPAFSRAVGDRVNSVFNYRGALAALGEGLSRERKFTEALGEAWDVAFNGGRTPEAGEPAEPDPEPVAADPEPTHTPPHGEEPDDTPDMEAAETAQTGGQSIAWGR